MIDIHAHILPGVDDGVRSLEEARELARRGAAEGVEAVAATPHVRHDYPTTADEMEHRVAELRADLAREGIPVEIFHGGEIDLGLLWEIPQDDLHRLTLAQTGRYLLVEFPYRGWPLAVDAAVSALRSRGVTPILAHPERNPEVQDRPERVEELVTCGALVQVTSGSLLGGVGRASQRAAEQLLELGLVHVLASDAHGPHIERAGLAVAARALGDGGLARFLTEDAPAAIVAGAPLPPRP